MSIISYTTYHYNQYISSCPWNISLQDLSIQLLQGTYPAVFFLLKLIWGRWLVRGVWNDTKRYYFSFPGLIRTGKSPTQTLSSISYKWNTGKKKKKKQDRGTHLWQQAHQQPLFCICSIINLICQIWFLSVLLKSWYTIKKAHIVNHREWWQFSSLVKEKRERQILQCAAFTFCTIWIFVTCITLEKQRGLYNFIPFKHYGPNLQPAWNAAYPLK